VLSKDSRDDTLHCIREEDAARLWSATVDAHATIIHTDQRHVYLLGHELVAIDLETGQRVWWSPHHGPNARPPTFTDSQCLIAGPRRTCAIDLETGKVTDYNDNLPTSAGGNDVITSGDYTALIADTEIRIYHAPREPVQTPQP